MFHLGVSMRSGALNITMLTTIRLHQSKGGTEKVMIDTANALVERGHKVTIVYRDELGDEPGFYLSGLVNKINCIYNKTPLQLSGFLRSIRSFSFSREEFRRKNALLKLQALASRFGPVLEALSTDVYITYEPKLSAMLVKELNVKVPIVTTFHFVPSYIANRIDSKWILPLIGRRSNDVIQVLAEEYVDEVRRYMPHATKIRVIPNAVTGIYKISELKNPLIVNVGRVARQKNQLLLVKAFNEVKDKFPSWVLEIWGETNLDPKIQTDIEQFIKENNLADRVFLRGKSSCINEKLANASIFAFPSIFEGLPLAMLEAMSSGLPCVGLESCIVVNSIIRENSNGFLCTSDFRDWANILEKLMGNYSLRKRLGSQAVKDAEYFRPDKIWNMWESLLEELVNRN